MNVTEQAPFPHGEYFGTGIVLQKPEGDYAMHEWECGFARVRGAWVCVLLDEHKAPMPERTGVGASPRDAFEELLKLCTFVAGGTVSEALRRSVPHMRRYFREDGSMMEAVPDMPDDIEGRLSDFYVPPPSMADLKAAKNG